jgi:hypothetical protein
MDIKWFNTDFENFNNTYKEVINYIDGGIKWKVKYILQKKYQVIL